MVQIIPAILSNTEEQFKNDITKVASSQALVGGWVHIDFADNKFVQNKTINTDVISKFPANFQKEAHLMVTHPLEWIDKLVEANFKRVIFHIECNDDIDEVINYAKSKGLEVGLAIKIETPIEKLEPFISKIDMVLVMSIKAGFQGQLFITDSLQKIRDINSKWDVKIGVDGAVKDKNIKPLIESGAEHLIVGSFLLKGNIDENLERLREIING